LRSGCLAVILSHMSFRKAGLVVSQQRGVTVMYDGVIVGDDAVDMLVEEAVIVGGSIISAPGIIQRKMADDASLRKSGSHFVRSNGICLLRGLDIDDSTIRGDIGTRVFISLTETRRPEGAPGQPGKLQPSQDRDWATAPLSQSMSKPPASL
jgi:hypothetical protein